MPPCDRPDRPGAGGPRCPPGTQRTCRRPDLCQAGPRRPPRRAIVSIGPLRVRILRREAPRLHRMCSPRSTFDVGPCPHIHYAPGEHPPRGPGRMSSTKTTPRVNSGRRTRLVRRWHNRGGQRGRRAGGRCPDCNKRASRQLAGALLPRFVAGAAAKAGSGAHSAPVGRDSAPREADLLHGEQRRHGSARTGAAPGGAARIRQRRGRAAAGDSLACASRAQHRGGSWSPARAPAATGGVAGRPAAAPSPMVMPGRSSARIVGPRDRRSGRQAFGAPRVWRRPSTGTLDGVRGISSAQRRCGTRAGCVSR